jgi:hypothetical protein
MRRVGARLECSGAVVRVDTSQTLETVVTLACVVLEAVIMGDVTFSTASTQKVCRVSRHRMRRDALTAVDKQRYLGDPALAATEDSGVVT